MKKFKLVIVNSDYCDYLRNFDNKITYNMNDKKIRPFIVILFKVNECSYFAPLSSPKVKHLKMKNTIDFLKIDNGKLGAVNFNNMIPVTSNNYKIIYFDKMLTDVSDIKYYELLKEQLSWLNGRYIQIMRKSYKLYNLYNDGRLNNNIMDRCCNFKLLEDMCEEYNDIQKKVSV